MNHLCKIAIVLRYTTLQWNLYITDTLGPTKSVLIIKVFDFSDQFYTIKHHLGPQLSVWITQVFLFSSVLINRFHCTHTYVHTCILAQKIVKTINIPSW